MSQENMEMFEQWWERAAATAFSTDLDLSLFDPDVLYEDEVLPDHVGEVYRGHDGFRRATARYLEPWEEFEIEIEWVRDAGDELVSCHRVRVRGKGSGIAGELRYAYLTRFRAGKIVYMKSYLEPADALRAAGLPE
jgi:ketosteroid isomerase-like protein